LFKGTDGIVHVVTILLTRDQDMQGMMNIIIPLGSVGARVAILGSAKALRLIAFIFEYEVNVAIWGDGFANGFCQLREYVWIRVVGNCVDGVEAKSVKVIFVEPIESVMYEEIANDAAVLAVKIDAIAPRSVMPCSKKLGSIGVEIVPFRAEMVVDDVEQDHQSPVMGRLYQTFKIFGAPVTGVGGEFEYSIVSPIASARKIRDRHQFDRCNSEVDEMVELIAGSGESSKGSKRADVELINYRVFPRPASPGFIPPVKGIGVDNLAGCVYIPRLEPGSGIGNLLAIVNAKTVSVARHGPSRD